MEANEEAVPQDASMSKLLSTLEEKLHEAQRELRSELAEAEGRLRMELEGGLKPFVSNSVSSLASELRSEFSDQLRQQSAQSMEKAIEMKAYADALFWPVQDSIFRLEAKADGLIHGVHESISRLEKIWDSPAGPVLSQTSTASTSSQISTSSQSQLPPPPPVETCSYPGARAGSHVLPIAAAVAGTGANTASAASRAMWNLASFEPGSRRPSITEQMGLVRSASCTEGIEKREPPSRGEAQEAVNLQWQLHLQQIQFRLRGGGKAASRSTSPLSARSERSEPVGHSLKLPTKQAAHASLCLPARPPPSIGRNQQHTVVGYSTPRLVHSGQSGGSNGVSRFLSYAQRQTSAARFESATPAGPLVKV